MAKSPRAIARSSPRIAKSIKSPTVAAKRRRVPVVKQEESESPGSPESPESAKSPALAITGFSKIEDAFSNLADSFRAYECLQSFLSPDFPLRDNEDFDIEPKELRGLVNVLNSDMDRQLQALSGAIRGVRDRIEATDRS